ncbi:hypothetical protein F3Y22_tig00112762pilonHSYRG00069 [Hibiscus syriacus]|uniref:Gnk2-homologous domain-containing protein n=1 Tax=Hibiscus syriacus TaxID=106335 RepID=A0A6A2XZR7_HIBSY|nr:hypothetical protein F3Y22_tig00112762pilonHSYRG00069 [Hibiscus syriacus]
MPWRSSTNDCQVCETFATDDISRRCPIEKEAGIWFDGCRRRYSNRNIFSIVAEAPRVAFFNGMTVSSNLAEQDRFDTYILSIINDTAILVETEAARAKKFATKEKNISSSQTLYTLVQCASDLSGTDYGLCLRGAIAYIPPGPEGGTSFNPNCIVSYELSPSYNQTAVAALTPSARGLAHENFHSWLFS